MLSSRTLAVNSTEMFLLEQGTGPLVVLCHGWPELSYSWRHQIPAIAAAGYHVVAPDMRGFGQTTAPADIGAYTILDHVGDMVALVAAILLYLMGAALVRNFSQAELKMVKYVEANSAKCGIPPQVADQLKNGHKNTEAMQQKVCGMAQQMAQQKQSAQPSLSDVLGTSSSTPEVSAGKKGGSTFDTLNGNALVR